MLRPKVQGHIAKLKIQKLELTRNQVSVLEAPICPMLDELKVLTLVWKEKHKTKNKNETRGASYREAWGEINRK